MTNKDYEIKINKKLGNTPIKEIIKEIIKVLRGIIFGYKFDRHGKLLRLSKGVRISKRNSVIELGHKVQLYRYVKLSAYGTDHKPLLKIGNGTSIGDRTEIHCGKKVIIGDNCNISWDVVIMDRDYHKLNSKEEICNPVHIKDNVWIGCRAIILKGITIEEGAVVAAGSVVTKNVPSGTIVAGNPAKIIKKDIYWLP